MKNYITIAQMKMLDITFDDEFASLHIQFDMEEKTSIIVGYAVKFDFETNEIIINETNKIYSLIKNCTKSKYVPMRYSYKNLKWKLEENEKLISVEPFTTTDENGNPRIRYGVTILTQQKKNKKKE